MQTHKHVEPAQGHPADWPMELDRPVRRLLPVVGPVELMQTALLLLAGVQPLTQLLLSMALIGMVGAPGLQLMAQLGLVSSKWPVAWLLHLRCRR
jgi:hypothetical protein